MFLLNLRIAMCRKQVARYIDTANVEERSRLYALTLVFVISIFDGVESILNDPMSVNKDKLIYLYHKLEDALMFSQVEANSGAKIMEKITPKEYQYMFYEHQRRCKAAANLIMVTLAVGINKRKLDFVRSMWQVLVSNKGDPELAIDYFVNFMAITHHYAFSNDGNVFEEVSRSA